MEMTARTYFDNTSFIWRWKTASARTTLRRSSGPVFTEAWSRLCLGPPKSDYEKVAPPNSFIHVQDFQTIQDLADYITRVATNNTLFNSYFLWRKLGSFRTDFMFTTRSVLCEVSDRLVADEMVMAKNGTVPTRLKKDWNIWWTMSCFNGENTTIGTMLV